MSRLHILAGNDRLYQCVLHWPVPAVVNAAGISYRAALANSGMARNSMAVGTGAGQITQAEADQIAAGEIYEATFQFQDDPNYSAAQRQQAMQAQIEAISNETQEKIANALRLFGLTRG